MASEKNGPSILFVNYTPYGGGDTVVVWRIATYLAGRGYRVAIATPPNPWLYAQENSASITMFSIPDSRLDRFGSIGGYLGWFGRLFSSVWEVRHVIIQHGFDIVLANTLPNLAGAFGALLAGRSLVWHVHEVAFQSNAGFRLLRGLPGLLASAVVCPSSAVQLLFKSPKTHLVRNTVPDGWTENVPDIRGQQGIPSDHKVFLWVGGVAPRKGLDVFIKSLRLLQPSSTCTVCIVAEASKKYRGLFDRLKTEAGSLGIRTIFAENVSDPRPWYAMSDIVVQTSLMPEAFGLTVLEAMAFGKPVICTGGGGMDDFAHHGINAHVVLPGDPVLLQQAICHLIDNPEYCAALAAGAAKTAAEHAAASVLPGLEEIYHSLFRK